MTRERLESYISNRGEIAELNYKLEHLDEDDRYYSADTVHDYRTGYAKSIAIVGVDFQRRDAARDRWTALRDKLRAECAEVEQWTENIQDGLTRRIFRMYYLEGRSQEEVGDAVYLDRSRVSRRITEYLDKQAEREEDT